jgi:hypothetical protein
MWVAQDKLRYESVYSINVYSHPLRIGSISVWPWDRIQEARPGGTQFLGCLEIHVDSKKRELRGCYTLKVFFFNRLVTEGPWSRISCHDNGNGAVHLGVCGWLGGFF